MKRRTLLQVLTSVAAAWPLSRLTLWAQPRELDPASIEMLRELGATLLPASLGEAKVNATVDRFVTWTKEYSEGVPLEHGYGHPRLMRSGPSPVSKYVTQLASLRARAQAQGKPFAQLDLEWRRAAIEEAFAEAGVKVLPERPNGQHIASDLAAFYFRSSEATDECYRALIGRQTCRPIALTTKRPQPLRP